MIGREVELDEYLEPLMDERLENLMEEIQEELRRGRARRNVY